jgi:putative ATP-dependent endonuclease of the OLD family
MAKSAKINPAAASVSLASADPTVERPRLTKLIIKNFRCIGRNPVEIDLDDIVVLVGENNVGKSSILKAYEIVMSQGSSKGELTLDDFPFNKVDHENLPEIEIHTIVFDNSPGENWIENLNNGDKLVREKFTWPDAGPPKRQGWDVALGGWSERVPWGAPNVANSRRPEPHRVDAFDPPSTQADAIKKLLMQALNERVKLLKSPKNGEENDYQKLLESIKTLQKKIVSEAQDEINKVNQELSTLINQVFPNYKIDFDARPEENLDKTINLFKADAQLLMGPADGYLSTIDRQGSGARRTLLWTALKFISESNQKNKDDGPTRPHLLLLDEPEICLHPNAIREACKVLYNLPESGNWQVMVTTHSPIFIDFSKDNTTIIRVEKMDDGIIKGTTVFRPKTAKLDADDKANLKLLNICDPNVSEFLFGGKTIIVEGDTEYTAFNYIKSEKPELYKNINIIRARGKATICSLIKVLNHFGADYSILHDSDTPKIMTDKGERGNPAWGTNRTILEALKSKPEGAKVRLMASMTNFERAFFGEEVKMDKPYNALKTISTDKNKFDKIEQLLKCLIDHTEPSIENCLEWYDIATLDEKVLEYLN